MAQAQITGQSPPPQPEPRRVTLDEYLKLLDSGPYEVIDGELIAMAPQAMSSSDSAHALYDSLLFFLKEHKLGRVRMEAAFALDFEPGENWVAGSLVPDVAFVSAEKVHKQKAEYRGINVFRIPPDMVVEVVSPSDSFSAVVKKVTRYLGYGVPLVWVIDPENQRVYIYTTDQPAGQILNATDTLVAEEILPGWSMPLAELFDTEAED